MSDLTLEDVRRARDLWTEQFAGGMWQFDCAYADAINAGETIAEAQRRAAGALLDAFVASLGEVEGKGTQP